MDASQIHHLITKRGVYMKGETPPSYEKYSSKGPPEAEVKEREKRYEEQKAAARANAERLKLKYQHQEEMDKLRRDKVQRKLEQQQKLREDTLKRIQKQKEEQAQLRQQFESAAAAHKDEIAAQQKELLSSSRNNEPTPVPTQHGGTQPGAGEKVKDAGGDSAPAGQTAWKEGGSGESPTNTRDEL
eukprot:TRINITY_DN66844_c6_g5_i1.p2 TRINITY_DN66844_c6_g5~~TRINITY_DN66844_c6_g5_i1.p2  ORF type:complete len:186 (+),score=36.39 TRINITY_DN66844_c6_g5_i1:258-815(+)